MIRNSLLAQQPFTIRHAVVTGFAILPASLGNPNWPRLHSPEIGGRCRSHWESCNYSQLHVVRLYNKTQIKHVFKARVKALYDGCRIHVVHLAATKAAMSHRAGTGDAPIPGLVTSRLGTQCDE